MDRFSNRSDEKRIKVTDQLSQSEYTVDRPLKRLIYDSTFRLFFITSVSNYQHNVKRNHLEGYVFATSD